MNNIKSITRPNKCDLCNHDARLHNSVYGCMAYFYDDKFRHAGPSYEYCGCKKSNMTKRLKNGVKTINTSPKKYIIGDDWEVELLCEHGVGHPVKKYRKNNRWRGIHTCDGCCTKPDWRKK